MKYFLVKDYEREQEISAAYDAAEAANDEAGMEAARTAHRVLEESIRAKGETYCRIYRLYTEARERGNEYIDLSDCSQYDNAEALIVAFREYGIERFTFSSSWSSAVESAWAFLQSGCTLEGMTELNGRARNFRGSGFEKVHGYIFKVN